MIIITITIIIRLEKKFVGKHFPIINPRKGQLETTQSFYVSLLLFLPFPTKNPFSMHISSIFFIRKETDYTWTLWASYSVHGRTIVIVIIHLWWSPLVWVINIYIFSCPRQEMRHVIRLFCCFQDFDLVLLCCCPTHNILSWLPNGNDKGRGKGRIMVIV